MSMSERARQTLRKPTTPSRLGASSPKPEQRDEAKREPEADDPVGVVNSHDPAPEPEPEPEAGPEPRDRPSPAPSPEPTTPNALKGDEPAMSTPSPTATLARQRSEATSEPDSDHRGGPAEKPSPLLSPSVDPEQMSELGHELDHLETIPTMSLEDFLTPAFLGRGDGGTSVSTSAPPSELGDAPYAPDDDLEFAEEVDPRVAGALDEMNEAMMSVNDAETALVDAKRRRRAHKAEGSRKIEETRKKLSSSVRAAVPFFHAQAVAHMYQVRSIECLRAYEKAHDMHAAAKESAAQLEAEMASSASPGKKITGNEGGTFDTDLMIALSDALSKVVETEIMKKRAEGAHGRMTKLATTAVNESMALRKKVAKSVEKAQPYFAVKSSVEAKAEALNEEVTEVEKRVKDMKRRYHAAMDELAKISEEVHARRLREKEEREAEAAAAKAAEEVSESRSNAGVEKEETPDEDKLSGDDGGVEDADDDASDSLEPESEPESEPEPEPESRDPDVLERVEAEVVESADLLNLDDDERTLTEEMEADFDSDDAKGNVSARIEEEAERAVADLDDDDDDLT